MTVKPLQTVAIITYGCQMNDYDSSRIYDLLLYTHRLQRVQPSESPDLIILNTCSIREKAAEKLFSDLGRLRQEKEKGKIQVIAVGGCVGSQEGELIQKRAPCVDIVFGPQTLHRLPHLLQQLLHAEKRQIDTSFPEIEKFDHLPPPSVSGPSAYVSIMEGCSKYCSYCIVPYTRGEEISRPLPQVMQEIKQLADKGVREITFLGQNVNDYRSSYKGQEFDLASLIRLTAQMESIQRIRFTTSHPVAFDTALIEAYAEIPKLVSHLHLPVQSGSDRILSLMKRGHTRALYIEKMAALRKARPDICISSDFIVGFPGETEQDFEDTLSLVKTIEFDQSFSFIYSPRPGTPAARIPDLTPLAVKKERLYRLQALLTEQAQAISHRMLDKIYPVLVANPSKKDTTLMSGRTENNRVVHFEAAPHTVGTIVPVKITVVHPNSLSGTCVDTAV